MEFHKKLYQLRKSHGLSQEELAEKLNVSRQTVSKWETGDSTPDMEKLVLLSEYFEISLDELILGKTERKEEEKSGFKSVAAEQIFTRENKKKVKKLLKIAGYILVLLVALDVLSLIIYAMARLFGHSFLLVYLLTK